MQLSVPQMVANSKQIIHKLVININKHKVLVIRTTEPIAFFCHGTEMYYNVVSTWRDDAAHLLLVNTPYLSWITREALREGRAVPRSHNVEIEVKNHFLELHLQFGSFPKNSWAQGLLHRKCSHASAISLTFVLL